MTPDQRQQLVNDHTCTDLDQLSADFMAKARAEGPRLLVERGVIAE